MLLRFSVEVFSLWTILWTKNKAAAASVLFNRTPLPLSAAIYVATVK
jgi:hypothetical protein